MKGVDSFLGKELGKRRQDWAKLRNLLVPALPLEYLQHISYAVADEKSLHIFTDSAAWTARIRFYDQEIIKALAAGGRKLRHVNVRTSPETLTLPGGGQPPTTGA